MHYAGGDQTANITYTLPISAGSSNQALTTNGTGVLNWTTIEGFLSGSGSPKNLTYWSGTNTLAGLAAPVNGLCLISSSTAISGFDFATCGSGGGVGDITGVIAGTGLSGGGFSGDVTLTASTTYLQRRVTGACAASSSIKSINADGTVSCITIPSSAICTWSSKTYSTGAYCWQAASCSSPQKETYLCQSNGSWLKYMSCGLTYYGNQCGL